MVKEALILAIIVWILIIIDDLFAWDATVRPLFVGFAVGLGLGDVKTGLIMGAELEAINMGVSHIGGVIPTDPFWATLIAVAYVILTGGNQALALSLSVPVGTIMAYANTLTYSVAAALVGVYDKLAKENNQKGYILLHYIFVFLITPLPKAIITFVIVNFGIANLGDVSGILPAFLINGLDTAGGMLVAVGFGILTSMIWTNELGIYFFVGFAFVEFLGLPTIAIAIFATAIAVVIFTVNNRMDKLAAKALITNHEEDLF